MPVIIPDKKRLVWLPCLLGLLAMTQGCDTQGNLSDDQTVVFTLPSLFSDGRALDTTKIPPQVSIDGNNLPMTCTGTNCTGRLNVAPDTDFAVAIEWRSGDLLLATFEQQVNSTASGATLVVSSNDYNTNHDNNANGIRDFDELDVTNTTDVDVIIPRIDASNAPRVDGLDVRFDPNNFRLTGEWANANAADQSGELLFIDNLMIGNNVNTNNIFHFWAAAHDGTYLYMLVVSDDIGLNFSDSPIIHDDDTLELFFDGNNSRLMSFDGVDDRHLQIALLEEGTSNPNSSSFASARILAGPNSLPLPTDLLVATGLETGPRSLRDSSRQQDIYEIRISLEQLGITVGEPFGIGVQLNDDDNGGARDSKWGWIHPSRTVNDVDNTWQDPSLMGVAVLGN